MLKLENLQVEIDGKSILSRLNLAVGPSEIHVIVGPNGAGKTTLARTISGLIPAKSGKIIFRGEDITKLSPEKRAESGIFLSFQEPPELTGISLEDLLRAVPGKKPSLKTFYANLKEYSEALGLPQSYSKRDLNVNFSGGEKKKMEILQLLMLKPKLAILDEIDSGLDTDSVKKVAETLKSDFDGALIIITHNAALAKLLNPNFVHIMENAQKLGTCLKTRQLPKNSSEIFDEILSRGFKC